MTTDLVGVLYNTSTGAVRCIIIPEEGDGLGDENILLQQQSPPKDCAMAVIARENLANTAIDTVIEAVNAEQKLQLTRSRPCTLVDKSGKVSNLVLADPVHTPVYTEFTVVNNEVGAGAGDQWDGQNYKREYAIYDKTSGIVSSIETVVLPNEPTKTAGYRAVVNNDKALDVGSIVGVVAIL